MKKTLITTGIVVLVAFILLFALNRKKPLVELINDVNSC